MSFHASQVNRGNLPKHCHICHITLYSHTVRTGPMHTVPPLLPTSSTHVHFFFPSFLLTSSPLYRYRGPPSRWQTARGGRHPFFHNAGAFFLLLFSISDCPFSPTCTRPPAPSSHVAVTTLPLLCHLCYVSHRPRYLLPHASSLATHCPSSRAPWSHLASATCQPCCAALCALAAPRLTHHPHHASSLSFCPLATHLPFSTRHVAPHHAPPLSRHLTPSSHVPLVTSPRAFVTRAPCHVPPRHASPPHLIVPCAGCVGEMEGK